MEAHRTGGRLPSAAEQLVAILRLAYSGERAAGLAYRGHWRALAQGPDRERVRTIEAEEWHHRDLVGKMLADLGAAPGRAREVRAAVIGHVLGLLCHVAGWLPPMYGAGRLESRNIREYETAARLARACNREEWVDCLLTMAEVEWDHEHYFRGRVLTHRLGRRLPLWPAPPPRAEIRRQAAADATTAALLDRPGQGPAPDPATRAQAALGAGVTGGRRPTGPRRGLLP